jgi:hypothetical protein
MKKTKVGGLATLLLAVALTATAQVPETISYQGRVTVAGTNFNGTGQFKFALVSQGQAVVTRKATATRTIGPFLGNIASVTVTDGGTGYPSVPNVRAIDPLRFGSGASLTAIVSGGQVTGVTINSGGVNYSAQTYIDFAAPPAQTLYQTFWSHDGTSADGSEPASAIALPIDQGLVTVLLGNPAVTNMIPLPASVFTNADARLRLWFNDGVQGFSKLSPDQPLGAVGYAMMAAGLPAGAVTSNQLAAGSVNSSHWSGTLPEAALSTNVALRLGGNAFSGDQTVMAGELGIGTLSPDAALDVRTKIISQGTSGNNHTNLVFKKTLGLGIANAEMVFSHRSTGIELWLYGNNGLNGLRYLQGWNYASNAVSFPANGQTLYIDEGLGRVGVGRKPVADVLEVGGNMSVYGDLTVSGSQALTGDLQAPRLNIGTNQVLSGTYATIAGGRENTNSGSYAAVAGGYRNAAGSSYATVGGGSGNTVDASYATVAGGRDNLASGAYATVAGGTGNTASGNYTSIGGGSGNTASYLYSTVPGGSHNQANGESSFAAGANASALHANSFVWGDGVSTSSSTNGDFTISAHGGVKMTTPRGIGLEPSDNPIITRGYDVFANNAPANKIGLGRWGMFMEPSHLVLGIPGDDLSNRYFAVAKYNTNGTYTSLITVNQSGNLTCNTLTILGGADLAEPFDISGSEIAEGAVVVIDEQNPGHLKASVSPYDTRVAGVVSGANGINPGIQMHQQGLLEGSKNIALTGRVYVQADASNGAIHPGDLLTTSGKPGRAMKVTDHAKAAGAVLGKAMTSLSEGEGVVLVLVTLQ